MFQTSDKKSGISARLNFLIIILIKSLRQGQKPIKLLPQRGQKQRGNDEVNVLNGGVVHSPAPARLRVHDPLSNLFCLFCIARKSYHLPRPLSKGPLWGPFLYRLERGSGVFAVSGIVQQLFYGLNNGPGIVESFFHILFI